MTGQSVERFDLAAMLGGPRHCAACAGRVCAAVRELEGVVDAQCDAPAGELEVVFDPAILSPADLRAAVERRVREESDAVGHAVYRLEGLD